MFTSDMTLKEINQKQAAIIKELREQLAAGQPTVEPEPEPRPDNELEAENRRLTERMSVLRSELEAKREVSKLDIRRDMLSVCSEGLKHYRKLDQEDANVRDAVSFFQLALIGGGGRQIYPDAEIGTVVPHDFTRHDGCAEVATGSPVRVVENGWKIPGGRTGDYILVKAIVEQA